MSHIVWKDYLSISNQVYYWQLHTNVYLYWHKVIKNANVKWMPEYQWAARMLAWQPKVADEITSWHETFLYLEKEKCFKMS